MKVVSIEGHPRQEELADYVSDALSSADALRIEEHVFECPLCAARLQEAASLQMLMHEAASQMETEVAAPVRPVRRWRVGALASTWAAAAAMLVMVCQQSGGVDVDDADAPTAVAVVTESAPHAVSSTPSEPAGSEGLLASVDPLQSIDPLQTWPDAPFTAADWTDDGELLDGEPCGSGEDGGPLVCQRLSG